MKTIDKNMIMMKAVKKADREIELSYNVGFKTITRIHKSKKVYDRKKMNKIDIFS